MIIGGLPIPSRAVVDKGCLKANLNMEGREYRGVIYQKGNRRKLPKIPLAWADEQRTSRGLLNLWLNRETNLYWGNERLETMF